MIIRVESNAVDSVAAVKHGLEDLADSWGCDIREVSDTARATDDTHVNDKVTDPVAIAAMLLSIPSAALAVVDIADRIHKRRRARKLIDKARQLADKYTTITLITQDGPRDLATLDPDQLLDLPKSDPTT
jgi:hypothetical protein